MSTTITSVLVQMLVIFLPMFGVKVGSDDLTVAVQTVVVVVTGLYIWFERVRKGDVKWFGARKTQYSNY